MPDLAFVCPQCRAPVRQEGEGYTCTPCARRYPILFGIPDFRLRGDRYLSLEQERDKARRLHEFAQSHSFAETVAFYYAVTDDVPPALAMRYQAYVHGAPRQAQLTVDGLGMNPESSVVLDAGCGSGGLLIAAAGRCGALVGLDIALRWLVICRKRLDEQGGQAQLVCADIESPPFPPATFTHIVAGDLVENVYDVDQAFSAMVSRLRPGGRLWLSASNRFCLGPQATTRIWGIGFLPRFMRSWLLLKIRGVDSLRFINLVSPYRLWRICRMHEMALLHMGPRQIPAPSADYPPLDRLLIGGYRLLSRIRLIRQALVLFGPAFEMSLVRKPVSS